jgi:hypothetical protein
MFREIDGRIEESKEDPSTNTSVTTVWEFLNDFFL